jgi:hypothetical protein
MCRPGVSDDQLPRTVRPLEEDACPFCSAKAFTSLKDFHSHVGQHMEVVALTWIPGAPENSSSPRVTAPRKDSRQPKSLDEKSRTDTLRMGIKGTPYMHCPTDQLEFYTFEKIDDWSKAMKHRINAPTTEILQKMKVAKTGEEIAKQLLEMNPLRRGQIDHLLQQRLSNELDAQAEWDCVHVSETNVVTKKKKGRLVRDVRSMDVIIARTLPRVEFPAVSKTRVQEVASPAEERKRPPPAFNSGKPLSLQPSFKLLTPVTDQELAISAPMPQAEGYQKSTKTNKSELDALDRESVSKQTGRMMVETGPLPKKE